MKNIVTLILILFASCTMLAQVGINNTDPKATLDVTAINTDGTTPEGLIAPRLTGDQIKAKDGQYLAAQTGAVVYVTSAVTGTPVGKTINITSAGYYFFDGTLWLKLASPVAGIDTTDDAWINNNTVGARRVELSTLADGTTTRPANSAFVALDNGNVGIGTNAPSSTLDVRAINTGATTAEGLIAPRLTGNEIKAKDLQYLAAQTGAIIYATAAASPTTAKTINITSPGYYFFDGTLWLKVASPVAGIDTTNDAWVNGTAVVNLGTLADGTTVRNSNQQFLFKDSGDATFGSSLTTYPSKLTLVNNATNDPLNDNFEIASFGPTAQLGGNVFPIIDLSSAAGTEASPGNFPNSTTTATGVGAIRWNARANGAKVAVANLSVSYAGDGNTNRGIANLYTSGSAGDGIYLDADNNVGIGNTTPNSKLQINGSFSAPIRRFSGNVLSTDYTVLGSGNVTLPSPVGLTGRIYNFTQDGTNYIVTGLLRNNGINVGQYAINTGIIIGILSSTDITVQSDGARWVVINKN